MSNFVDIYLRVQVTKITISAKKYKTAKHTENREELGEEGKLQTTLPRAPRKCQKSYSDNFFRKGVKN